MPESFDLLVIGGGTAGLVTTAGASYLGARVALVERERLGGDCLWTGCVPSKALLASSRAAQLRRDSGHLGIPGKAKPVEFGFVMASLRAAREVVSHHDDPARFRAMGAEVVSGPAAFRDPRTVQVGERLLTAKRVVVATGALPQLPPIAGLAEAGPLTHRTIFEREEAPASLAVIGGGPVGVELAQAFQRLGVPTVLLETLPQILGREDPEAAVVVRAALEREGVTIHTGAAIEQVVRQGAGRRLRVRRSEGTVEDLLVGEVLVATGRRPATEGLGLEALGLEVGPAGLPVDATLRTRIPGLWAAGDVTGGPQFTHVADYQARLVVRNALTPFPARTDYRAVPRVTYCDPEVAQVGLTELEAVAADGSTRVWRYDFADLDRAITDRRREGFVKLVATRGGRLLGATIVGAGAGELISLATLALRRGLRVGDLADFIYPYPTMAEGLLRAANLPRRATLGTAAGRLLKRIVRWGL